MNKLYGLISPLWQPLIPYLALLAAVLAAYCNVYNNEFLFDDGLIITRNTLLQSWDTFGRLFTASTTEGAHIAGGFYRPVQNILYFFTYQIDGEDPVTFHLLNIIFHGANTCLIYALGRKLGFNPWAVFFAALIWALHPVHTEAVTYMSATADTLYSFFCLLGIVVLLPDFTPRKFIAVIPIFLLGLLSKETAAVFPLLVTVTMYMANPKSLHIKTYLRTWPLWAIAGLFIFWRMTAQNFDGPQTYARIYQAPDYHSLQVYSQHFELRLYTFFATLPAYLGLLLWPEGLHMERNFPIFSSFWNDQVLLGFAMCAGALAQIGFVRSRSARPFNWGLLWFGAAHFPDTGLLVGMNALFLEHWMYLPTAGLFLGLSQSLFLWIEEKKLIKIKRTVAGAALCAGLVLGTLTFIQNETWHDPVVFYTHMFKFNVISARARNNLALAYVDLKDYPHAVEEFHKAIAISDTYPETRHNLALALLDMPDQDKHLPEAIANLQRALELNPNFYRAYIALSQIYAFKRDPEKAAFYKKKAEDILANDKFSP